MSVQPVWVTPTGSLGTIPDGVFYSVQLEAVLPNTVGTIYYELIAGQLPTNMAINSSGLIEGTPKAIVKINGVPTEVSYDVTSEFVIRAYTTKVVSGITVVDRFRDETFNFVVSGGGQLQWITPPGQIASYTVGETVEPGYQLLYTDTNTADQVSTYIFSGSLPPGLTLNSSGLISGYIGLVSGVTDTSYTFTVALTNGLITSLRTFSILVLVIGEYTVDNVYVPPDLSVDSTNYTVDISSTISPFITNPQGSIGTSRGDSYFAYQFFGLSLYGNPVGFVGTNLPPNLTLDPYTGWLYGYIANIGASQQIFNFQVQVYPLSDPSQTSPYYDYSLTVDGSVSTGIAWLVPPNLGTIGTGMPSTLYVEAIAASGLALEYRLDSTTTNQLPPGLTLQPNGTITGTVGFETFTLDSGTTTIDNNTTTFDLNYTFTVNAYSAGDVITSTRTFTIEVTKTSNEPWDNLYIKCMPPIDELGVIDVFLSDTTIFPTDLIYRPEDSNFGVATSIKYYHAYGLTAATTYEYLQSLVLNHYWKQLTLGEFKTARATDDSGNTLYEVIYVPVIDNLVNNSGESISKDVVLPYPLNPGTLQEVDVVFPNSLVNMRNQVIDVVGQVSNILPRWMVSRQLDGTVLGFTPCWVIAYCKPGTSGQVLFNIQQQFGNTFNTVNFKADRYELDRSATYNWDPVTEQWLPVPLPAPTIGPDQYDSYLLFPKYNVITNVPQVGNVIV